jgi:hypothetical protein
MASFGFVRFAGPLFSITWWLRSSKIDTLFFVNFIPPRPLFCGPPGRETTAKMAALHTP